MLIAGAGPAGLETALALRRLAGDRVAITLLDPAAELVYRPLSVAEPFGGAPARRFSVARLADDCGFTLRRGTVGAVDTRHRSVLTGSGETSPTTRWCWRSAPATRRPSPARSPSAGRGTPPPCATALEALGGRPRVAFVAGARQRLDAPALRARPAGRPLGARARHRDGAVADHARAAPAARLRRARELRGRRAARGRGHPPVDRRRRRARGVRPAGAGRRGPAARGACDRAAPRERAADRRHPARRPRLHPRRRVRARARAPATSTPSAT